MINEIHEYTSALQEKLIKIRRHLHAHPELSFQEQKTMEYIANQLDWLQIPYQKGVAGTGIIAIIEGKNPEKKCIALRADIDALPIQEENNTSYKSSIDGVMHACGHDVHTTCLLGAAEILNKLKNNFEGTVKLIFQPGEEKSPGGASLIIAAGGLQDPEVDAIVGLHVYPELSSGTVAFRSGQYMASADEIHITINGKGGHAALPHTTVDPIMIAANILVSLQQVISRRCNPLLPSVLSFGKISGGNTTNVIPERISISGTFRTFDEEWRQEALNLIRTTTTQYATAWGATAEVIIPQGYPSLYNDPQLYLKIKDAAKEYLGEQHVAELDLRMTAEDFSFYTQQIPGCFFRLGTNKDSTAYTAPVHNAHFDVDETALKTGAGMMAWAAITLLT